MGCLNLNITRPAGRPIGSGHGSLPIFLFIHGGGFANGSAGFPQYDMSRFVRLSVSKGLPVIAITMNYRLGAPGWLTSSAMREGPEKYVANNGLRDQRVAMRWVRTFVAGFGGDPAEITVAGESAGGVSCCFHLQSEEKLFKRVMAMSGTSLLLPPLPLPVAEATYQAVVKSLGLQDLSPGKRVERLKTMPAAELREKTMGFPLLPVADPRRPLAAESFAGLRCASVENGCESLLLGDCAFDGSIQALRLEHRKAGIGRAFRQYIDSSPLPGPVGSRLLDAYRLSADRPDEEAFRSVLEVLNDVGFYAPTLAYARAFRDAGKQTWVYRFNALNPWPEARWCGTTPHILDIAFLFQNYNDALSPRDRGTAEDFAETVFRFVRGEDLWEKGGEVARVFGGGPGQQGLVEDVPEQTGRRGIVLELAKEVEGGMDALSGVVNGFMRAPPGR